MSAKARAGKKSASSRKSGTHSVHEVRDEKLEHENHSAINYQKQGKLVSGFLFRFRSVFYLAYLRGLGLNMHSLVLFQSGYLFSYIS